MPGLTGTIRQTVSMDVRRKAAVGYWARTGPKFGVLERGDKVLGFRFRARRTEEDFETYDAAFVSAWHEFCQRKGMSPNPTKESDMGDPYLNAWNAVAQYKERPVAKMTTVQLPAWLGCLRPGRYWWKAKKYFRKNPMRLWWVQHVWSEVRIDWTHRNGKCRTKRTTGKCWTYWSDSCD